MLKIYGSMRCPDCVACCRSMDDAGRKYEFFDIDTELVNLKEFLKLRDTAAAFDGVRGTGVIGIPCIVLPDGTVLLEWETI